MTEAAVLDSIRVVRAEDDVQAHCPPIGTRIPLRAGVREVCAPCRRLHRDTAGRCRAGQAKKSVVMKASGARELAAREATSLDGRPEMKPRGAYS